LVLKLLLTFYSQERSWSLAKEISWLKWGLLGSGKLLGSAFSNILPVSELPSTSEFVSTKLLDLAGDSLLKKIRSTHGTMKMNDCSYVLLEDLDLRDNDKTIVLPYLVANKHCKVQELQDGRTVIKFSNLPKQTR